MSNRVGHNPKVLEVQFSRVKILLETNEIAIVYVLSIGFFWSYFPQKNVYFGVFGAKRRNFFGVFKSYFWGFPAAKRSVVFLELFLGFRREAPKNAKNSVF